MRLGIISDTHGSLYFFEKAMEILEDCDRIIHAGDVLYHGPRNDIPGGYDPKGLSARMNDMKNIYIARGNCDSPVDEMVIEHPFQDPCLLLEFNDRKIFVTHGYTESKLAMIYRAKEAGADILIYGHTHIKEMSRDDEIMILNPGSTSIPKDGIRSCAIIDTDCAELWDIENAVMIQRIQF